MTGVLITGGLGFMGSHLAAHLLRQGIDVTLADVATEETPEALQRVDPKASAYVVSCDVGREDHARRLLSLRPFDHVVHLAGVSTAEAAALDPQRALRCAASGTLNLLEACISQQPNIKSVAVVSTDRVYGDLPNSGEHATEDLLPNPLHPYAQAHWIGEQTVGAVRPAAPFPISVLRTGTVLGPWDMSATRLLPRAARRVFGTHPRPPAMYSQSVNAYRYILDITDFIAAWEAVTRLPDGGVFNVVPEHPTRMGDLLWTFVDMAAAEVEKFSPRRASWIRENGVTQQPAPAGSVPLSPGLLVDGSRLHVATGLRLGTDYRASLSRIIDSRLGGLQAEAGADAPRAKTSSRQRSARHKRWLKPPPDFVGPFAAAARAEEELALRSGRAGPSRVGPLTWQ